MREKGRLYQAILDAHIEMCRQGDCDCITREEHERMLELGRRRDQERAEASATR